MYDYKIAHYIIKIGNLATMESYMVIDESKEKTITYSINQESFKWQRKESSFEEIYDWGPLSEVNDLLTEYTYSEVRKVEDQYYDVINITMRKDIFEDIEYFISEFYKDTLEMNDLSIELLINPEGQVEFANYHINKMDDEENVVLNFELSFQVLKRGIVEEFVVPKLIINNAVNSIGGSYEVQEEAKDLFREWRNEGNHNNYITQIQVQNESLGDNELIFTSVYGDDNHIVTTAYINREIYEQVLITKHNDKDVVYTYVVEKNQWYVEDYIKGNTIHLDIRPDKIITDELIDMLLFKEKTVYNNETYYVLTIDPNENLSEKSPILMEVIEEMLDEDAVLNTFECGFVISSKGELNGLSLTANSNDSSTTAIIDIYNYGEAKIIEVPADVKKYAKRR